jgi:hypothetical protein
MQKIDLKKELKYLYAPSARQVEVVDVPRFNFVMVDGEIEPGASPGISPAYQQALEALYGISFTLKFSSKLRKENPIDYSVMALEGLWWVNQGEFDITRPENWSWTAMMMQPDHITGDVPEALAQLRTAEPALTGCAILQEGLCIQTMHTVPTPRSQQRRSRRLCRAERISCGQAS